MRNCYYDAIKGSNMKIIEENKDDIIKICQTYNVRSLAVFGSVLTEDFKESSDIDVLLELDNPENGMVRYMNIKFELEKLFNRSVDIVMPGAIKNQRIKKYIFSNVREIYAA